MNQRAPSDALAGRPATSPRWFRVAWSLLSPFPTRLAGPWRNRVLSAAGARVGAEVTVGPGVRILGPARLDLRDRAGVARDACLDARGGLVVEEDAMVGLESLLLTWTHRHDQVDVVIRDQGPVAAPITVGAGAWIGARCMVLPGVTIGPRTIVGAMSLVTKDQPAGVVAVGAPARVLRSRDD